MYLAEKQNIESDDEKKFSDYFEFVDQCPSSSITKEKRVSRKEEDHFELIDGIEDDDHGDHAPRFIGYELIGEINANIDNYSDENWGENPFILDGNEELYQDRELVVDFIRAIEG